jgi:hypothetical protein
VRYTKELQDNVCKDIKYGLTPQECADKYNIPVSVVIKWNGLEVTEQRAAEIAVRKYQVEVSETEADITNKIDKFLDPDISDDDFDKVCNNISKPLYKLVASVVKKERQLNPHEEPKSDAEVIIEITKRWENNQFIKRYAV